MRAELSGVKPWVGGASVPWGDGQGGKSRIANQNRKEQENSYEKTTKVIKSNHQPSWLGTGGIPVRGHRRNCASGLVWALSKEHAVLGTRSVLGESSEELKWKPLI